MKKIPKILFKEKQKQSLLGFNDLLTILLKLIKKDKILRNLISNQYPIAFVDEFQDTDIEQYKIFNFIYKNNEKTGLFLVGDPKQAIYSFRGADIFSYLYAKSKIKNHYYLDTNWRSSENICKGINLLFSHHSKPFIFKNIPFTPILPSFKNSQMNFKIKGISQTALGFFLQEKKEVYIDDYQNWIAKQCANEISYWLYCAKKGEATIATNKGERILKSNDIAILVRNQTEASIIQNELNNVNIISIYSSHKYGVFQTFDAQELLWILQSILEPTNEKLLQQSISTHILQSFIYTKENTFQNKKLYLIIERLYKYYSIWKKIGIFYMIKTIILEYQTSFNMQKSYKQYQKNINFLHIAELLQEKSQYLCKKISLIRWFQKKTVQKKISSYNEHIRFFNESKSIKIMTIHKSKGLEYPIIWIPFSIDFNESKLSIYHNKKNFKTFFDLEKRNESLKIADAERLAEDLRFLYVALTRSILHCSIGIACLIKKKKIIRKNNHSDIHRSALGYIIQNKKSMDYENLLHELNILSVYPFIEIKHKTIDFKLSKNKEKKYFISKNNILKKDIKNIRNITSFTKLNEENLSLNKKNTTEELLVKNKIEKYKTLTIHNFPEGKKTGLLIHYILKNINFTNQKDYNWYANILEIHDFSKKWALMLMSWINNIVNTPLNNENIVLSKLKEKEYTKELEFFLPIKNILCSTELNSIIRSLDPISLSSPEFLFNPVTGILKGFIDLVFLWKNKYYILDYKSNWLGKNNNFYCNKNIKKEIIKHRYDLQYQIYTIAIHQYLKQKIKKYNYNANFGGIFYMFLRGIEAKKNNNGIFYTIPNYLLIKKFTNLISEKKKI